LVGERQREAPLGGLAQDGCKAIRREVLELVGVQGEVAAILLWDVGAALAIL
jgi:hypothetical protein